MDNSFSQSGCSFSTNHSSSSLPCAFWGAGDRGAVAEAAPLTCPRLRARSASSPQCVYEGKQGQQPCSSLESALRCFTSCSAIQRLQECLWQCSSPLLFCWGVSRWSRPRLLEPGAEAVRSRTLPGICEWIPGIWLCLALATLKNIQRKPTVRESHCLELGCHCAAGATRFPIWEISQGRGFPPEAAVGWHKMPRVRRGCEMPPGLGARRCHQSCGSAAAAGRGRDRTRHLRRCVPFWFIFSLSSVCCRQDTPERDVQC